MNTITFLIQPPYLVLRLISAILANEMVTFCSLDHHSIRKRQKLLLSAHFERLFALVFKARAIPVLATWHICSEKSRIKILRSINNSRAAHEPFIGAFGTGTDRK